MVQLSFKTAVLMLLLTVCVVFGNTFLNEWTYDDFPVVVENPDIQSIPNFIRDTYPGRPLREITYLLDYQLFGDQPAGYRVQQLGWHFANGVLLLLVCLRLGLSLSVALPVTLLFLVHPFQVESVANISHRKELLALFFVLGSFLAYLQAVARVGKKRALAGLTAILAFGLAMSANMTVVALPLVCLWYEAVSVKRKQRLLLSRPWLTVVGGGLAALSGWFLILSKMDFPSKLATMLAQNNFYGEPTYLPLLLGAGKAVLLYLKILVWPWPLAPEAAFNFSASWQQWAGWVGLVALVLLPAAALLLRKRNPLLAFGLGWIFLFYLPVSNLLPLGSYIMADRYMYLVLPGFCLAFGAVTSERGRPMLSVAVYTGLLLLAGVSILQNTYWKNDLRLYVRAAEVNSNSVGANWSAANHLVDNGEPAKAKVFAQKVLELNRYYTMNYYTLGRIEYSLGNKAAALTYFQQFLRYGGAQYPQKALLVKAYLPMLQREVADAKN